MKLFSHFLPPVLLAILLSLHGCGEKSPFRAKAEHRRNTHLPRECASINYYQLNQNKSLHALCRKGIAGRDVISACTDNTVQECYGVSTREDCITAVYTFQWCGYRLQSINPKPCSRKQWLTCHSKASNAGAISCLCGEEGNGCYVTDSTEDPRWKMDSWPGECTDDICNQPFTNTTANQCTANILSSYTYFNTSSPNLTAGTGIGATLCSYPGVCATGVFTGGFSNKKLAVNRSAMEQQNNIFYQDIQIMFF